MRLMKINGEWTLLSWTTGFIHSPIFQKEKCTLNQITELVKELGIEDAVYAISERGCEQWALWLIEHQHLFVALETKGEVAA